MSFSDRLNTIQRWLQKKDEELLYDPDGLPQGEDGIYTETPASNHVHTLPADPVCPCVHCLVWRDEPEPHDIPLPEIEIISYTVEPPDPVEGETFSEAFGRLLGAINRRNGRESTQRRFEGRA